MRAREVMTAPVVTVTPGTTAKHAAELLIRHGFTALPVVDEDERLVGIVTEADLVRGRVPRDARFRAGARAEPGERPPPRLTVGAVMSAPAVSASAGDDVAEVVAALLDAGFRAMPVVDRGRLAGIVTRGDIVRALSRDDREIARDVRHQLEIYGGAGRWDVVVRDGVANIVDQRDDPTDRHVATVLAESVPGVVRATVHSGQG
ncbi:CBS domain protein [Prauserella shujinwangii]|uniref:CBS domain protein n=1 Tax=Prauserella shujinwangii TaxID=1453103 RepID=A0A2T0LPS4_9PSEU|nr:CBS domain-containing protein [Prauserella shujinwangii]PRX45204.1 CBS domain protein [Prauserella shujinwangii]